MSGYTKLFNSILTSTIWCQDSDTRVVWITLLAMADAHGMVEVTLPGLAKAAGVPLEKAREAIAYFEGPDPESRSVNNGGSRLTRVNNGWQLVNYGKYRVERDKQHRKLYMRDYMRNYRNTKKVDARRVNTPLTHVNKPLAIVNTVLAQAEAYNTTPYNPPSDVNIVNNQDQKPEKQKSQKQNQNQIQNPNPRTQNFPSQQLRSHPMKCVMPGCENPARPGQQFCSDNCKDYAHRILNRV